MADITVHGADDFLRLSKALKAAGRTELRKELNKGLRDAAKPLIPRTRAAARERLPREGGFGDQIAREPQRVQVRTGLDTAGVRIVVGKRMGGARAANRGTVRHPVFGTGRWVDQEVEPGWFDETLEREAPGTARPALDAAIDAVLDRVVRDAT